MIKVIIFDFDGTLYNAPLPDNWKEYVYKGLLYCLKKHNCQDNEAFIKKYHLNNTGSYFYISTALIQEYGTAQSMIEYLEKYIYRFDNRGNLNFIQDDVIKALKQECSLYIVSGSSVNYLKHNMQIGGLSPLDFKGMHCSVHKNEPPNKLFWYKKIIEKENVQPEEVMVIGDNLYYDLYPAMLLGAQVSKCQTVTDVKETINLIKANNTKEQLL